MVAVPTAILVLNIHQLTGGGIVPFFPVVTTLHQQAFACHQETHKFFAAIVAKASQHIIPLCLLL